MELCQFEAVFNVIPLRFHNQGNVLGTGKGEIDVTERLGCLRDCICEDWGLEHNPRICQYPVSEFIVSCVIHIEAETIEYLDIRLEMCDGTLGSPMSIHSVYHLSESRWLRFLAWSRLEELAAKKAYYPVIESFNSTLER